MTSLKLFGRDAEKQQASQDFATGDFGDDKQPATEENLDLRNSDGESISSGQDGVKKAQATTIVWTKGALITAYGLYVLRFRIQYQPAVLALSVSNVTPY